jgi:hypothetical protein
MATDEYRRSALRVRYNVLEQELSEAEQREHERFQAIERELEALATEADSSEGE